MWISDILQSTLIVQARFMLRLLDFVHNLEEVMKKIIVGLMILTSCAASALADGEASFDTPSRNMCCHYIPAGGNSVYTTPDGSAELSCDRVAPKYWVVSFTELGRLKIEKNPGEVPGCGNPDILGYGQTRVDGPFTCTSSTSGLTCKAGRKGFKLSKTGFKKIN